METTRVVDEELVSPGINQPDTLEAPDVMVTEPLYHFGEAILLLNDFDRQFAGLVGVLRPRRSVLQRTLLDQQLCSGLAT